MKVLLYTGDKKLYNKSGIGKAMENQKEALIKSGVPFTTKLGDDYDVVQLNTVSPASYLLSKYAKRNKKRVVYYAHSTEEDFKDSFIGSNFMAPAFKKWISICYKTGDVIITPTEYSKNLLKGYNLNKPIYSLSNGIDTSFYKGTPEARKRFRDKYEIKEDENVIISVGHYIERKGIIEFVELAKKLPQYKFYWFGHTPKSLITENVREAVSLKLDNLFFPGYVNREELRDAYCGSDLFLFLTHEETEGIVILEALASKIPILVRNIPVYKNWLIDGYHVYKASDEAEFINKINMILNAELTNLTDNGYELAKERDLKTIGMKLKTLYANDIIA